MKKMDKAFGSYHGRVHNVSASAKERFITVSASHVPLNLASSGYPEFNLPEGSPVDIRKRMMLNAICDVLVVACIENDKAKFEEHLMELEKLGFDINNPEIEKMKGLIYDNPEIQKPVKIDFRGAHVIIK